MTSQLRVYRFLFYWALANLTLFGLLISLLYFSVYGSIFFAFALLPFGYLMSLLQTILIEEQLHWKLENWETRTQGGSTIGTIVSFALFLALVLLAALLSLHGDRTMLFLLGFIPYISFRMITAIVQSKSFANSQNALRWIMVNLEGGCLASALVFLAWINQQSIATILLAVMSGVTVCALLTGSSLIKMKIEQGSEEIPKENSGRNHSRSLQMG